MRLTMRDSFLVLLEEARSEGDLARLRRERESWPDLAAQLSELAASYGLPASLDALATLLSGLQIISADALQSEFLRICLYLKCKKDLPKK